MPAARRLIVKIGSSSIVDPGGAVRSAWLATLATDLRTERDAGRQVGVVTSGAIAIGARRLSLKGGGRASLEDAQAAAAVGQIVLAQAWADALAAVGLAAAQLLLTLGDLEDRRRYLNASATLERLFALGVVPVINENDSVATQEIRFGDNDGLAARVAVAVRAERLVLLSDVDGLFSGDPASDPDAKPIAHVESIDGVEAFASRASGSAMGTGGMAAKLAAARVATRAGVELVIASSEYHYPLARVGTGAGTVFAPQRLLEARGAWLSGLSAVAGALHVDAGAASALRGGASLLAAGIRQAEGAFDRGEVVDIVDEGGRVLARGLAEYGADDVRRIAGQRSEAIGRLIEGPPRAAVVHRDHMVLL